MKDALVVRLSLRVALVLSEISRIKRFGFLVYPSYNQPITERENNG